jgi:hypothetical protein
MLLCIGVVATGLVRRWKLTHLDEAHYMNLSSRIYALSALALLTQQHPALCQLGITALTCTELPLGTRRKVAHAYRHLLKAMSTYLRLYSTNIYLSATFSPEISSSTALLYPKSHCVLLSLAWRSEDRAAVAMVLLRVWWELPEGYYKSITATLAETAALLLQSGCSTRAT